MDKLDLAIQRMQMASELSLAHYGKPILLTYSGGKDSDVCIEIAKAAGVPFEVVNSHTTADAPETVYYIRRRFAGLELDGVHCEIVHPTYKGKPTSMWDLIPQKFMPPTRLARYCCAVLKETAGANRAIVTGVRWEESTKRAKRGICETITTKPSDRVILNNDNDDNRRFLEHCQMQGKIVINPIIDWTKAEVWDFLHERGIAANPLYQCGFSRVGCLGCPMAGTKGRAMGFRRYPAYKRLYIHAFDRMLAARTAAGKETSSWRTGYDVYRWWMEDDQDQMQFDWYEEADNNG